MAIDANGNIKVGGVNCVVSDRFCRDWSPCNYCEQERERLFQLRLKKSENEHLAAEAAARAKANAELVGLIAENPKTSLAVAGGIAALLLGVAVADKHSKSKKNR